MPKKDLGSFIADDLMRHAKQNGEPPPLPEHRQKQVEAGLATYQSVLAERDVLERQCREYAMKLDGQLVQLNALQGVINMMESTMKTCQIQRDEAVERATRLQTTLANVAQLLNSEMQLVAHDK